MTDIQPELVAAGATTALVFAAIAVRPRTQRSRQPHPCGGVVADRLDRIVDRVRSARRLKRPVPAEDVADWCDRLARSMRSGSTLRDALVSTKPPPAVAHATAEVKLRLERGQPIASSLDAISEGVTGEKSIGPHLDVAYAVITIAERLGGSNAAALDRAAGSLRLVAADRQERVAQAAQARLSAHVLTVVPLAMLAMMMLADGDVRTTLRAPVGATCVAVGLVLNGVGWKWMRHIIGALQ